MILETQGWEQCEQRKKAACQVSVENAYSFQEQEKLAARACDCGHCWTWTVRPYEGPHCQYLRAVRGGAE